MNPRWLVALACLAATVPAAAAAEAASAATVVVLQPGDAGAATRAAARTLLAGRVSSEPVAVVLTSDPASVLLPPTRSAAAVRAALASAPAAGPALGPTGAARAVGALAARFASGAPSVVLAGADAPALTAALRRRGLRPERLAASLGDSATATAPAVDTSRVAAVAAAPADDVPLLLVALAAAFAAGSAGLVLRARPAAAGGAVATRVTEWTAYTPVAHDAAGDEAEELDGLDGSAPAGILARIEAALDLADMQVGARDLVLRTALGTAALAVVLFLLMPLLGLLALVAVPLGVRTAVRLAVRRRRAAFAAQLGDAVQAIASAMRAGHGLSASMAMLVPDLPEPMQHELRAVVAAERIGVPFDEALDSVVQRMANRDLEQVALVASLQRDTGGNGAEALDRVVETIRARDDVRRLIHTLTAQGRMSRWVMTGLPVGVGLVMTLVGDGYLAPLVQTGAGLALSGMGVGLVVAGSAWIGRVVQIDV